MLHAMSARTSPDTPPGLPAPSDDPDFRYHWEDFPVGLVQEFGQMPIEREATIAFASQYDPQPFHLDDEAAAASLFGRLSASGWHTACLMMRMLCDHHLLRTASLGSPGIDSLRWLQPVYPGDTLAVRQEVLEARVMQSRPHVGLVKSRCTVLNQRREAVMTLETWGMIRRREAPSRAVQPDSAS
jgi:acyl dehydratase